MKISFIRENELLSLKSNIGNMLENYAEPNSAWIQEYFGYSPFTDTKFEIDDFELDMSEEHPFQTEFENVKRVFNQLKFLTPVQASDERLWAGLCLTNYWKYVQYRWNIVRNLTVASIKQHYFFGMGARRSLTRNAMSRLWWIGRLTYDRNRRDPFELTKFVCENADYILHVLERNTSNNLTITRAFISALLSAKSEGYAINTDTVAELSRYLNLLGGTYLLDCLPETVIQRKIYAKAISISVN